MLRLLTVDDEPHIHAGLDAIMDWASLGYEHAGAAVNGQEALAMCRDIRPDVVLTDIRMPGMDGLELIRLLRDEPDVDPTIVVVSGYNEFEYARESMRYGVQDYLLKPIDEDELARVLTDIRERSESFAPEPVDDDRPLPTPVLRLLSGDSSAPTVDDAAAIVALPDSALVVPVVMAALATDPRLSDPLTAMSVTGALRETKVRNSADWVVDTTPVSTACLLVVEREDAESNRLRLWLRGLHRSIQDTIKRPIVIHCGKAVPSVSDVPASLQALRGSIIESPLSEAPGVVVHEEGADRDRPAVESIDALVTAIEDADESAAVAHVDRIAEEWQAAGTGARHIRDWITRLRLVSDALIRELECDPGDLLESPDLLRVARYIEYMRPDVVAQVVRSFSQDAVATVARCRSQNRSSVVALLRRKVDRKYDEELTLNSMAEVYGMSAVYLGQLFRKVSGKGFRDYLREVRVKRACRLLRDTDLYIPEIAREVGYRDSDFFGDQFKRETGMTPNAYRSQNQA